MQRRSRTIPYITLDNLFEREVMEYYVYPNIDIDYYWSDDFSPQMYIALAQAGFISITHEHNDQILLLPEMQRSYAVLDFKDLHISKRVKRLIHKGGYRLSFNTRFSKVITAIENAYNPCWIRGEYRTLMETLSKNSYENFSLFSTELFDEMSGELIAGEIGYITHNVYTSLSGFHVDEKRYDGWGSLQLVLLGQHLESKGIRFWNLGHPYMEYKTDLGAKILTRGEFLEKWRNTNGG